MSPHTPNYSNNIPPKTIPHTLITTLPLLSPLHNPSPSFFNTPPTPLHHRQKCQKIIKNTVPVVTGTHFCLSYPIFMTKKGHFDPQKRPGTISTPKIAIPILKSAFSSIPHASDFRTEILPPPTP
jgi:hypothetical protein